MKRETTTLTDIINSNGEIRLTEEQLESLVKLLGERCRQDTKKQLYSCLKYLGHLPNYGIFARVQIEPHAQYYAGQSYPDEIRTVRDLIIGRTS